MKILLAGAVAATLMGTSLIYAATTADQVSRSVQAAVDYGITHFNEIEFERDNRVEIEGWMGEEWYVEIEISGTGSVNHEERERRINGPWGMSADEVIAYAEAAFAAGISEIEDIQINSRGVIEIEGEDEHGRDIDVYFQTGSTEPVNIVRDN